MRTEEWSAAGGKERARRWVGRGATVDGSAGLVLAESRRGGATGCRHTEDRQRPKVLAGRLGRGRRGQWRFALCAERPGTAVGRRGVVVAGEADVVAAGGPGRAGQQQREDQHG